MKEGSSDKAVDWSMSPVLAALAYSLISGLFLHYSNRRRTTGGRWAVRIAFVVVAAVLSTMVVGVALGDDVGDMLSLSPVFIVYSFEALAISVVVGRCFGPLGVGRFMLIFLPAVLVLLFVTTFLLIGLYPGS